MKSVHILYLFKQLSILLELGFKLPQSLHICLKLNPPKELKYPLKQIIQDLELGEQFITALQKQKIDTWTLKVLRVSDETSQLQVGLNLYLKQHENRLKLKKLLVQQLFYPGLLMIFAVIVLIFFMENILPHFQTLYQAFHMELPSSILFLNQHFNIYYGLIPIGLFFMIAVHQKLIWSIPFIGRLKKRYHWAIWFNLMEMGLGCGMTFEQSLNLIAPEISHTHLNSWHKHLLQELQFGHLQLHEIQAPNSLPSILHPYFTMLAYDTKTHALCHKAYQILQHQIEEDMHKLSQYLQPFLLLLVSLFCTYVLYIFYQPLLHLQQLF
jgi:type II secretory pathway component PulF